MFNKKLLLLSFAFLTSLFVYAAVLKPVQWSYKFKKTYNHEAVILIKADIDKGWHIYGLKQKGADTMMQTSFFFFPSNQYILLGNPIAPKPFKRFEKVLNQTIYYFEKSIVFQQKVKLKAAAGNVKGTITYMACNDKICLPPNQVHFSIPIK